MTEYKQLPSGIVLPEEKPTLPPRSFQPLEIRNPEKRALAIKAMVMLWEAMNLLEWSAIPNPDYDRGPELHAARLKAYRFLGEMILGEDCPEGEQWC